MRSKCKYHVTANGSIVDECGAVLYDADCLEGLTLKARRRLAQIHTKNDEIDWEHAEVILRREGFRTAWREATDASK